jgi:hypothetical protein
VNLLLQTACGNDATTGVLQIDGKTLYSIELPWHNNDQDISCVPAGTYDLIPYQSPSHGSTWRLHNPTLNVYGYGFTPEGARSQVEMHSANWARQLKGCIAFGLEDQPMIDPATGIVAPAVEESVDAISELTAILAPMSTGHTLTIERDMGAIGGLEG